MISTVDMSRSLQPPANKITDDGVGEVGYFGVVVSIILVLIMFDVVLGVSFTFVITTKNFVIIMINMTTNAIDAIILIFCLLILYK